MLRCTSGWVQSWNRIFGLIVVQAVHIFNIFTCSERITIAIQILLFKTKLRLIYYSLHSLSLHKWNEQAALWKCLRSCKPKREHITSRKCLWNVWPCLELFYMTPSVRIWPTFYLLFVSQWIFGCSWFCPHLYWKNISHCPKHITESSVKKTGR